jgi:hypothetical protein
MRNVPGQPLYQGGDEDESEDGGEAPADASAGGQAAGAAALDAQAANEDGTAEGDDEEEEKEEPLPPGSFRHTLTFLKDGPIYRLRCAAYNQRGNSVFSQVSESFECLSKMQWMQAKREAEMAALSQKK